MSVCLESLRSSEELQFFVFGVLVVLLMLCIFLGVFPLFGWGVRLLFWLWDGGVTDDKPIFWDFSNWAAGWLALIVIFLVIVLLLFIGILLCILWKKLANAFYHHFQTKDTEDSSSEVDRLILE